MRTLFWMSMGLLAYTYIGYPVVLWVLARRGSRDVRKGETLPFVSIIIAARNEADQIRHKIDQTLALNYPEERREILVGSDASDDGTDAIVRQYAERSVHLVRAPQRRGKEHVQGLALAVAKGDVIVFTDTATTLEPDALTHLARNFAEPTIGAVSTEDVILDAAGNPTAEGFYVQYEMGVRRLESRFHSLVGLSGSCFAIRKELCANWPTNLASDFMGALSAARGGYRSVAEPLARGRFVTVRSGAEFRRKVRTFLRGITVLGANRDLLNPLRYGRFAFQLASHKVLRCLAPFLLLVALVAGGVLRADPIIGVLFWLHAAFYMVAGVGGVAPSLQRYRSVRVAHYFTMAQLAMLVAWGKYVLGQQQVTWEPSRREGIAGGGGWKEGAPETLTVCHLFSGDLWAGAEVMIFNLLSGLRDDPTLRVIALSLNDGVLTEKLRAAGITTHVIPETRYTLLGILRQAAKLLKKHNIAIIHSHRYKENVLAWSLARWLGIPEVVTTIHGLPERATNGHREARWARCRTALDYFVLRNLFSSAVAVSGDMKRVLVQQYGFADERVQVIRNGGQFPRPTTTPRSTRDCFHIGTVARMVPVKGLELFLEIAGALRREMSVVRFSILGDGALRHELARRAASLNISDCVEFVAPRSDPFGYYDSLDLYLNTSWHEGLPLSVVEAMACGKPVVSSAVGGIPEVVVHGETGFLVEGREADRFAEQCLTLIRDGRLRAWMGARASVVARARFSARAMADAYRDLYEACSTRTRDRATGRVRGGR